MSSLGTSAFSKLCILALILISKAVDHYQGSFACFAGYCNQSSNGKALLQVSRVATLEKATPTAALFSKGENEFTPDIVPSSVEDAKILKTLRHLIVGSVPSQLNFSETAARGQELQRICALPGSEYAVCALSVAQRLCSNLIGAIQLADDSCVHENADINRLLFQGVLTFKDSGAKYPVDEHEAEGSLACSAEDAKKLAICMCVKNEEITIAEFIQWHRLLGVGHFYVYDDGSTDRTHEILGNFSKDVVTIVDTQWGNGSNVQMYAFTDCAHKHGHKHEWLGFLDADEFVQPVGDEPLKFCLFPFLQGMQKGKASSVQLNWAMGFSDDLSYESDGEKTVLEQIGFDGVPNPHTKSFCRPECIFNFSNPHWCNLKATPGTACKDESLNTDGKVMQISYTGNKRASRAFQSPPIMTRFRIVHYHGQPFQGWLRKKMRGRATTKDPRYVQSFGLSSIFSSWTHLKDDPGLYNKTAWWPDKAPRDVLNKKLNEQLKAMVVRRA